MLNEKDEIKKVSDEDLNNVAGGVTKVYNPIGINDIKYSCSKCGFAMEIDTKGNWKNSTYINRWKCPQCGTNNTTIFEFKNRKIIPNYVEGKTYSQDEIKNLNL